MTRAVTGAVAVSLPHPPQARALVSSAPPAEAPPRRPPRLLVFVLSLVLALTTRARVRHGTPIIRPSVRMTAHFARADRDAPLPPARERARPRPPSGDIVTRRHDDANLGWQAAAAAPCVTEPPNPNPNDARMARMTRDPAYDATKSATPRARTSETDTATATATVTATVTARCQTGGARARAAPACPWGSLSPPEGCLQGLLWCGFSWPSCERALARALLRPPHRALSPFPSTRMAFKTAAGRAARPAATDDGRAGAGGRRRPC